MLDKFFGGRVKNDWWLILVVGLVLRLILINQSFWLDEAAQAIESARPLAEQFDIVGDFQPPLFHLLVHWLMQVGNMEWWLRMASLVPGLITIVYTYKIAKVMFGKTSALMAGLMMATSGFHVYYSQELRPYSLAAMWGTMSMWYFLTLLKKSNGWSWRYVLTTVAGLYTMYLLPFLTVTQLLIAFKKNMKRGKKVVGHLTVVGLLFVPWLPTFIDQVKTGTALTTTLPGWGEVVSLPWYKSLPLTAIKLVVGVIRVEVEPGQILLLAIIFGGLIWIVKRVLKTENGRLLAVWLGLPVLMAFGISFWIPVLEPKRVLFVLPAFYILLGVGVEKLKKRWLASGLIIFNLVTVFTYYINPVLHREEWREAVMQVEKIALDDSVVVFAFPQPFAPWQWYQEEGLEVVATGTLLVDKETNLDEVLRLVAMKEEVYVFEYLMDLSDPERRVFAWLEDKGYQEIGAVDFNGVGLVHIYKLPRAYTRGVRPLEAGEKYVLPGILPGSNKSAKIYARVGQ